MSYLLRPSSPGSLLAGKVAIALIGTEESRRGVLAFFYKVSGSRVGGKRPLTVAVDGKNYELQFEESSPTRDNYKDLSKHEGFYVVYSATNRDSLSVVMEYLYMIQLAKDRAPFPCVIAALSSSTAKVLPGEGEALAKQQNCPFDQISDDMKELCASVTALCEKVLAKRQGSSPQRRIDSNSLSLPSSAALSASMPPGRLASDPAPDSPDSSSARVSSPGSTRKEQREKSEAKSKHFSHTGSERDSVSPLPASRLEARPAEKLAFLATADRYRGEDISPRKIMKPGASWMAAPAISQVAAVTKAPRSPPSPQPARFLASVDRVSEEDLPSLAIRAQIKASEPVKEQPSVLPYRAEKSHPKVQEDRPPNAAIRAQISQQFVDIEKDRVPQPERHVPKLGLRDPEHPFKANDTLVKEDTPPPMEQRPRVSSPSLSPQKR